VNGGSRISPVYCLPFTNSLPLSYYSVLDLLLADILVVLHLAFVIFVVLGGLLVLRAPCIAYLHLPAAAWGMVIEFTGWICPLTPLELWLREKAGGTGYQGGFIAHYILPVLYPSGLTRNVQLALGACVFVVNLSIYLYLGWRRTRRTALPHRLT
jgi:Protein of Unknown function (DUF2784)